MDINLIPCIEEILKDKEFLSGGIFSNEKECMKKYNLTEEQSGNLQTLLYLALNVRDDDFIKEKLYK